MDILMDFGEGVKEGFLRDINRECFSEEVNEFCDSLIGKTAQQIINHDSIVIRAIIRIILLILAIVVIIQLVTYALSFLSAIVLYCISAVIVILCIAAFYNRGEGAPVHDHV
jgi:hypothetical protein